MSSGNHNGELNGNSSMNGVAVPDLVVDSNDVRD